jgi:16S rRNA G527 N7-methylase RsmG
MRFHIKIHNFIIFVLIVVTWDSGLTWSSSIKIKRTAYIRNSTRSEPESMDSLVDRVERIASSQTQAGNIAASMARDKLAQISSHWAKVASKLVYWKANEVMELTKKAQDAQLTSLKFSTIASQLKSAAMSADQVFNSAFERFDKLLLYMLRLI